MRQAEFDVWEEAESLWLFKNNVYYRSPGDATTGLLKAVLNCRVQVQGASSHEVGHI
jgi:hypothetical protein